MEKLTEIIMNTEKVPTFSLGPFWSQMSFAWGNIIECLKLIFQVWKCLKCFHAWIGKNNEIKHFVLNLTSSIVNDAVLLCHRIVPLHELLYSSNRSGKVSIGPEKCQEYVCNCVSLKVWELGGMAQYSQKLW